MEATFGGLEKMLSSSESREFVTVKKFTNYKLHYGLDCQGDRPWA